MADEKFKNTIKIKGEGFENLSDDVRAVVLCLQEVTKQLKRLNSK